MAGLSQLASDGNYTAATINVGGTADLAWYEEVCSVGDDGVNLPSLIIALVIFIAFMGFQLWLLVHSIAPQLSH
jgi:hypothetical protein